MSIDLPKDDLHHAYLVAGERERAVSQLINFLEEELDIATSGNPDYFFQEHDVLGIDTARTLRKKQERKAFAGDRKIFIVSTEEITHEAQNSLLKSFEEPTAGTHFFIILPSSENVLPTLLSRVEVITGISSSEETADNAVSPESFLSADLPDRLEMLSDIISEKDSRKARQFLDAIEEKLYENSGVSIGSSVYDEIDTVKKYLTGRGASVKTLLQHIALVLPKL